MIKIQISDIESFKRDYLSKIKDEIVKRITNLKNSASHLKDPANIDDDQIVDAKHITKNVLDLIRNIKIDKRRLNKAVYKQTLQNYRVGATVTTVDWDSLLRFLNYLLDDSNHCLEELLVGAPESLSTTNTNLLNKFSINSEIYIDILKNAFSYDSTIGIKVRQFFHEKNITVFCPYCNISRAFYSTNDTTGQIADQHQLDHFFDKATYPLLSLSAFNLIPSDSVCNTANKNEINFSDELHLNPYISGFKNDMKFEPLMNAFGEQIQEIKIKLNVDRHSVRWKQLIGNQNDINLAPKHGNINVFQIHKKYNLESIHEQTSSLVQMFRDLASNEQSLRGILNLIEESPEDNYENFKSWYEKYARTKFHQREFGKIEYSKLNRDLLDFVFANSSGNFHERVNNILTDSYLPANGGE